MKSYKPKLFEITLFPVLGGIMLVSKLVTDFLPNIHLLGVLTAVYTLTFGKKALIPIYIYVFLNGVVSGFNSWWVPYLYVWTVLWLFIMLIPKNLPEKAYIFIYPAVTGLHGLLFGTLYSPAQAIMFGLNFKETVAWIIAGLPFDLIHAGGNTILGFLIIPLTKSLKKAISRLS